MLRAIAHWPVLAVAVVLLWSFPFVEPIRPPHELAHLYQARALVEDGTLHVDGMLARHGHSFALIERDGHLYADAAPGLGLLGAAVFFVHTAFREAPSLRESLWVLEKVLLALPTLVVFVLFRQFLRRRFSDNRWAVDVAIVAWALGSVALPYSLLLHTHQLAALLLVSAFMAYARSADGRGDGFVALGGFLGASAVLVEYTSGPAVLVLAGYALLAGGPRGLGARLRRAVSRLGYVVLGSAVPGAVFLWYHQVAFGGPLATGFELQGPTLAQLGHALVGAAGLLTFSPWLALAGFGVWLGLRRSDRRASTLAIVAVSAWYLLLAASVGTERWGWTLGPRHLTAWTPFLVGPVVTALSWLRDRPGRLGPRLAGAAMGLCAFSLVMVGVGCVTYPHIPPAYDNPFFQLSVPLLLDGYIVHNLGSFLADRSAVWTLAPVFVATGGAALALGLLAPGRASARGRLEALGMCLGVLVVMLGGQALRGAPRDTLEKDWRFIVGHYDPLPGRSPGPLFPPHSATVDSPAGTP